MASDRAFDQVDKILRKHDSRFLPDKYKERLSKSGKTLLLEEDFNLYNFKEPFKILVEDAEIENFLYSKSTLHRRDFQLFI